MRDILFKAKRIDTGEWVEGFFCYQKLYCYDNRITPRPIIIGELSNTGIVKFEIDESTICQYTGMTDKNGQKIWENDIIKLHQFLFDGSEYEKEILISIEYMSEMMCFVANLIEAKEIKRYMGYKDEDTEKVVVPFNDFYGLHEESFEVIGNVFDNKEILERKE